MMRPRSRRSIDVTNIDPPMPEEKHMKLKRLIYVMMLSLFSMGFLTACNTMAGVGEDVQQAGEAVEDEAEGHIDCDTSDEC